MAEESAVSWVPLESNPDVMNKFLHRVGVPSSMGLTDVYGLDPELLAMVPQPVAAVLLLFPITDNYTQYVKTLQQSDVAPMSLFYLKQTVGNSCGTVGLVHCVANNSGTFTIEEGSVLGEYIHNNKDANPEEKGNALGTNSGIHGAHVSVASEGQTAVPDDLEKVVPHYCALVHHAGGLWELDGRKPSAIHHGPTTPETLLQDAAKVCKAYMERDPDNNSFNVMALTNIS